MSRYRLKGKKEYTIRRNEDDNVEVYINPQWVTLIAIEGLNELEGNKLLDEHYGKLITEENESKAFLSRVEEFRQRYNQDKLIYVKEKA